MAAALQVDSKGGSGPNCQSRDFPRPTFISFIPQGKEANELTY